VHAILHGDHDIASGISYINKPEATMMSLKKDDTEMTEDFVVGGLDEHRSHANTVMGSCNMPKEEVSNDSSKLS